MNKKPKISSIQLALVAAGSALMFPYTFLPIVKGDYSNQDTWLMFIVAVAFTVVLHAPFLILLGRTKDLNFFQRNEVILGKAVGKAVTIIFSLFTFMCFTLCSLITVLFVRTYIMINTPVWALLLAVLVPATYASIKGAGTISRLSVFIVPFILLTIIFFFFLGLEKMDFKVLKPMLADSSMLDFAKGVFFTSSRFSEILIIILFSYFLIDRSKYIKSYFLGLIVFAVSFLLILLPVITALGPSFAKITNNPYYIFTRQVGGYDFVQRVQSLNILAWFSGTIFKMIIFNYMTSYLLSGVFNKKSNKVIAIIVSLAGFMVGLIPFMNKTTTMHILSSDQFFPWIVFSVVFVIPSVLLIVYFIRRKKIAEKLDEIKEQDNPKQVVGL